MSHELSNEQFRPLAYVALKDAALRRTVRDVLEHAGWTVVEQPTGFHLLRAIAGLIEGLQTWRQPGLIVVDALADGCAGTTIALGLRELGISIPVVIVADRRASHDQGLTAVDPAEAPRVIAELAGTRVGRHATPRRGRASSNEACAATDA